MVDKMRLGMACRPYSTLYLGAAGMFPYAADLKFIVSCRNLSFYILFKNIAPHLQ